jgi:hypothetical protein
MDGTAPGVAKGVMTFNPRLTACVLIKHVLLLQGGRRLRGCGAH